MPWHDYLAWFFAGAFFANAIPHLVNGVSGRPFQTPFASPPGKGLSSSVVNMLWAAFNIVVGYLLVTRVGQFDLHSDMDLGTLAAGAFCIALFSAYHFGKFNGGK